MWFAGGGAQDAKGVNPRWKPDSVRLMTDWGLSVCVAATAHRPAKIQKAAFFCIRGRLESLGCLLFLKC